MRPADTAKTVKAVDEGKPAESAVSADAEGSDASAPTVAGAAAIKDDDGYLLFLMFKTIHR